MQVKVTKREYLGRKIMPTNLIESSRKEIQMLGENQIKRVLEQCLRVNESYENANPQEVADFKDNDYYVNVGWIQALKLVMEQSTHPISQTPLKAYEEAYNILMQFFEHIPDTIKPVVHKELEELGL